MFAPLPLDKVGAMYEDKYEDIDEQLTDCNVGSQKRRNIRCNLFVMSAVTSASKKHTTEAIDICVYNVMKCFSSRDGGCRDYK